MYKDKKIVAIIPARKGSKGIPNKNIALLNGMPLVEHSIIQAKKVTIIDEIIVSTDSKLVQEIAIKHGIAVDRLRPIELSNDQAKIYDVIVYEIKRNELMDKGFSIVVLLQPTSPLRRSYMIEEALKKFVDDNQYSAVSVSEAEEHPIFMRTINNKNQLVKVVDAASTVRRQDLEKTYVINGMIYINYIKDLITKFVSLNDNISPIVVPKELSVDIDTIDDLDRAQKAFFEFIPEE